MYKYIPILFSAMKGKYKNMLSMQKMVYQYYARDSYFGSFMNIPQPRPITKDISGKIYKETKPKLSEIIENIIKYCTIKL